MPTPHCRFAPTPSGPAHPGTLLAGLLCWLDARSRGAHLLLRLEDVDATRCTPEHAAEMRTALAWLGLDWDAEAVQSERRAAHEAALDRLAAEGLLYPCSCSRSAVRAAGTAAVDGGWRYPGNCRGRELPPTGWRGAGEALRLRLPAGDVPALDEDGSLLCRNPSRELGDPVLLRRDAVVAYHLAVVVDDAADAITRIVRGRDLAACTAIHRVLQQALGLPAPTTRHHLLLLEESGGKLAKLHGAVGWRELVAHYAPERLCGVLARVSGLRESADPTTPAELLADFAWERVQRDDALLRWTGSELEWQGAEPSPP